MRTAIRWFKTTGPGRGFRDEHVVEEIEAILKAEEAQEAQVKEPEEPVKMQVTNPLAANELR